jgi:SdrD B-like domain
MRLRLNGQQTEQPGRSRKLGFRAQLAFLLTGMLASMALLWGCAGVISGKSAHTAPPPQSYSISGTISPTAGGNGATVALSGVTSATTTADSSGKYTFTGLTNGTYAVTPSHTGYTFSPSSQAATVHGTNVTGLNFTATVQAKAHSVALSWNASTSTVSGYNVYRTTASGIQYARLTSSLVGGLAYTDMTVQNGITYYYVTTAVDASGNESPYSNAVSANVP